MRVRFLTVISILVGYTAFKVYQLWPTHPLGSIVVAILAFVVMLASTILLRGHPEIYDRTWFHLLTWAGSIAMALWATFILLSIPLDILNLLSLPLGPFPFFVRLPFLLLGISVLLVALGFVQAWRGAKIKETHVQIENLTPALEGLKLLQISDLHVGPTIRAPYVREVVARANAVNPDLIFMTGDIADAHAGSIVEHTRPLSELKSRYGVFYVTGNHEYYWGVDAIVKQLQNLGIQPLLNKNAIVKIGDAKLMVAGVNDPVGESLPGHTPDLPRAAKSATKADLKVVLAHRPDVSLEAEPLGFDLQFSGHTHAGQFFPFSLLIGLAHKYSRGLYRHGNMWVYVNPGTGYWGPANRLGVTPEISLIILSRTRK